MKNVFLIFIIFVFSTKSHGIVQNNFLTPIGGIEGITGNTGVARRGSVGNVIFNPGGLAFIQNHKVSVSGSAFSQNWIDITIGNNSERINYFQTTPSQITTVYHNAKLNYAFSILVPKVSKFRTSFDLENQKSEVNYEDQETYIGPTVSYKLSEKFSFGFSIFGIKRDFSKEEMIYATTDNITAQRFFSLNITGFSLVSNFGLSYAAQKNLLFGINLQTPKINLSSSFESKTFLTSTNQSSGTNTLKGNAKFSGPGEIALGFEYDPAKKIKLLMDLGYQFSKYSLLVAKDASGGSAFYDYKNSMRVHLGFEYYKSKKEAYTFGANYNQKNESSSLDFLSLSLGYRLREKVADSMLGLFLNKSIAEKVNNVETNYLMAGIYLSSSINFID